MALGRKTGGRTKGTPNRTTADVRSLAQSFGPAAIAELARLAGLTDELGAEAEATRVAAIRELLDRGYGRATLPLSGDADRGPIHLCFEWADAVTDPKPAITSTNQEHEEPGELRIMWESC